MHVIDQYMRTEKLPHIWCSGCGNGIVVHALIRAIKKSGINQDNVVLVAGIGCSCRADGYMDFCGVHTNHGRALAYATGIKMQNPDLHTIVITGDGDCTSIGGNHFIHAARRNIDITTIVFNNSNYGMTGGQYSPTTPVGSMTKTSQYGNIEPNFDICELDKASGATYVARSTAYHAPQLAQYIEKAILHKGFSMVEAVCDCPTLYGRFNKRGDPVEMLKQLRDNAVSVQKAEGMTPEQLEGKIIIGEFACFDRPEYTAQYDYLIKKAVGEKE